MEEVKKYENAEILPDQVVKEVEVMYSTSGNVVFQLNAPLLHQYGGEKNYNEMLEGVEVKRNERYYETHLQLRHRFHLCK